MYMHLESWHTHPASKSISSGQSVVSFFNQLREGGWIGHMSSRRVCFSCILQFKADTTFLLVPVALQTKSVVCFNQLPHLFPCIHHNSSFEYQVSVHSYKVVCAQGCCAHTREARCIVGSACILLLEVPRPAEYTQAEMANIHALLWFYFWL